MTIVGFIKLCMHGQCNCARPMHLNKTIAGYKPVGLYMTTAVYGFEHDQRRLYTSGLGHGQYMYICILVLVHGNCRFNLLLPMFSFKQSYMYRLMNEDNFGFNRCLCVAWLQLIPMIKSLPFHIVYICLPAFVCAPSDAS